MSQLFYVVLGLCPTSQATIIEFPLYHLWRLKKISVIQFVRALYVQERLFLRGLDFGLAADISK